MTELLLDFAGWVLDGLIWLWRAFAHHWFVIMFTVWATWRVSHSDDEATAARADAAAMRGELRELTDAVRQLQSQAHDPDRHPS